MNNSVQLSVKKLKALRFQYGLSQERLANESIDKNFTLSLSTIKRAELGKPVSYRTAVNFSRFYNIALEEITNSDDSSPDKKTNEISSDHLLSYPAHRTQNTTSSHFVGRTHELMQVSLSLRSCKESKEGCIFYIRGVAGIGKTAFMQQCKARATEEGYQQIHIENNALADISWMDSFQHLIEGLLRLDHSSSFLLHKQNTYDLAKQYQLSEGEQLQLYLIFDLPLSTDLKQLHNTLSYAEQLELQNSLIIRLLGNVSQPLLLSIEDLHFAPEKLLYLLKHLSNHVNTQAIIFIFSARLEEDPLDFLWRSHISSTPFITLDLTQVSAADALKISQNYACHDTHYQQQCLKLSKGNPLFLHQLLLNYPATVAELPSSILKLCQTKINNLSEDDYDAICISSLVGERIDTSVICYVLNMGSFDPTTLIKKHLLIPDNNGFRFYHGLIRNSINQLIDNEKKSKWHIKISQWYKGIDNTLHAKHLLKARRHLTTTTFVHIAEELIGKHNYADALDIVDKALNAKYSSSQYFSLLLLKGELLYLLGLPEKAIHFFQQALKSAIKTEISKVHIKLATVFISLSRINEAKEHINKAGKNLKIHPDKLLATQLRICLNQTSNNFQIFDHQEDMIKSSLNNSSLSSLSTLLPKLKISQDYSIASNEKELIHVGILHSQTGFLKELESGVIQCTLMAINEINNNGGLLGKKIHPILVDAKSEDDGFYQGAKTLLNNPDIVTLFGCSTSSSRKRVKPLVEKANHLLVYPFQYEGIEQSSHIAYVGPTPNQQALPAIEWLIGKGKQRFLLIGSDYIYPKVTNKLIKQALENWSVDLVGEYYAPLGKASFENLTQQINTLKPDAIISTVVGFNCNKVLLQAIYNSERSLSEMTTLSLVLSEDDLLDLPNEQTQGVHTAFSYFQNINDAINDDFVRRFKQLFGVDRRIGGYMEAAYTGVNLWAKGVQKAGRFKPADILQGMQGVSYYAPGGMAYFDEKNNHVWRHTRLAVVDENKEYQVLWSSTAPIKPTPYPQEASSLDWKEKDYLQQI